MMTLKKVYSWGHIAAAICGGVVCFGLQLLTGAGVGGMINVVFVMVTAVAIGPWLMVAFDSWFDRVWPQKEHRL